MVKWFLARVARPFMGERQSFQQMVLGKLDAAAAAAKSLQSSVQPHRWQPIRLHHPWDSPGKNTGVGCHFLLQCMKSEKWRWSRSVMSNSSDRMDCSLPGSSIHGMFQARVLEWGAIAFSECEKLVGHNFSIQTPCLVRAPGGSMGHRINKSWSEWSFYFLASFLSIKYIPFFMSATLTYPVVNKAKGFLGGPVVQNLPCNAGDTSTIPGPGRSHLLQGI